MSDLIQLRLEVLSIHIVDDRGPFDLSPNLAAQGNYVDPGLQKRGDILANAKGFTPDIGDSIVGGFGNAEWTAIVNYVNGQDLQAQLDQVAQVQKAATGK
ncbi:MAG TPA: hypothetical protein VHO48_09720 [Anaerolineaceae bacterium]|nr:hypothetical protein [Anaerolineaceae bacterium]